MDLFPLALIAVTIPLGLAILAFWIWMIVDCVRNESREGNDRIVWLVIIVAAKFFGALIYYFVRRPERMRSQSA